jgi:hypothetical protein
VYDDNGVYTGRVTLTDDEDASDSETFTVRVNNVPPRIVSQPPLFGQEGVQYTYTVSLTDPGDDTFTYTLTERPQGMTVSNAGVVSWTPNAQQALEDSWRVALTVRDDDGGTVSQEWDISLNIQDADGDTLPDACERLCQGGELDANAPNDANGDADADNLSNAQECSVGANPCFFNGPTAPTPLSPLSGLVEVSPVEFIFTNATDPDGDPLSYKFELAPLEQPDQPFVVLMDIVEGQGQTMVSVMESEGLLEDSQYIWRARANDGTVDGPWSEPGTFRFSLLDQPPGRPVGVSPVGVAGALTPALVLNNTTDPEEQAIEYQFQVSLLNPAQGEEPFSRTSPWVAQRGGGTTSWTVDVALQENRSYTWQAKARDVRRNEGPWSVGLVFQVNGDNAAPPTPTLLLPEEGQVVEGEPLLVAKTVVDEDGDRVSYIFRLSSAADFNEGAILASSEAISPEFTEGEVSWTPTGVVWAENTAYWWSVQAFDTSDASNAPATRSFRLSARNEAPDKPVLVSPVGDSVISEADPTMRWTNVTDPDGDKLAYVVEVFTAEAAAEADRVVISPALEPSGDAETTWDAPDLGDNRWFWWRVTATDSEGASTPSELGRFFVNVRNDPPSAPAPTSPLVGAVVEAGAQVTLTWENATDREGDALTYSVEVYQTDGSQSRVFTMANIAELEAAETSLTLPTALPEGGYRWSVKANDGVSNGPVSVEGGFTVRRPTPNSEPPLENGCAIEGATPEEGCRAPEPEAEAAVYPTIQSDCTCASVARPAPHVGLFAGLGGVVLGLLLWRRRRQG